MPFRFIHTADIHLDSPLRSLSLRNAELAELIGDSTRRALVAIVDLCMAEQVDALLIAGDLYDGDQTSMKTARFLASQMDRLHQAGVAVYTIRGNHDALSRITQELILPPSARVFGGRAEAIEARHGNLDVVIHGLSFARPHAAESLLPKYKPPQAGAANIGIMHTSLAGAPGHDPYAPCSVADLHAHGFDYWALGHIHQRSQHAGDRTVIMPGMPQGRNINEAGEKTVSLVTIGDDRSVAVEERLTGIAQFERIDVDLGATEDWRDAVDRIERAILHLRGRARSPHLVGRLTLRGATQLAWRLRRDGDLLLNEIEHRLEGGKTWIEKIELALSAPAGRPGAATADPVIELGELMREDQAAGGIRDELRQLVKGLRDDLPAEARGFCGDDEAGFEAFIDQLLAESSADMLARLKPDGAGT